ncbi:MAG: hypothetical protein ACKESB_02580 [Candidatus Hodgkinia cicadicola]
MSSLTGCVNEFGVGASRLPSIVRPLITHERCIAAVYCGSQPSSTDAPEYIYNVDKKQLLAQFLVPI